MNPSLSKSKDDDIVGERSHVEGHAQNQVGETWRPISEAARDVGTQRNNSAVR